MRVTTNKTKKGTSYYIIRSVSGGSTEIVEKLGYESEIKAKYLCDDALAWAKQRAKELTEKEQESQTRVMVPLNPHARIASGEQKSFNVGYLFLQQIYHDLRLDNICRQISKRHSFEYDLNEILSRLVYGRILFPCSKLSTTVQSRDLFEQPSFQYQQVARALSVLAEESDFIQSSLYKNSSAVLPRKTGVLYYDCTNFYFELEEEKGLRTYGRSKENRPNPIVEMGMFMDYSGLPLAITINSGNTNEQTTLRPLEEKILGDFELSKFVVCTDAGLSSDANRRFNNFGERSFITTQSIRKMNRERQAWCLDTKGWKLAGDNSGREYDISIIDASEESSRQYYDRIFYKETYLEGYDEERDIEFNQTLLVSWSLKYRDYQHSIREAQIDRAQKLVRSGKVEKKGPNDVRRFIDCTSTTGTGEKATKKSYEISQDAIDHEAMFDGFYAICTNLEDDPETLLKVNKNRWEIEESFRIMKTEFRSRPVYVQRDDRIQAHFLTCFIALLVYRILEKKLGGSYTASQIIQTLRQMNVTSVGDAGYVPAYTRTPLTDDLHETAGFHTDYELLRKKYMQGVVKKSKH